jgi:hypothetical protein
MITGRLWKPRNSCASIQPVLFARVVTVTRALEPWMPDSVGTANGPPPPKRWRAGCQNELDAVVQLELERVRTLRGGDDLLLALVRNPRLDQVGREHAASREELVVLLEGDERLRE